MVSGETYYTVTTTNGEKLGMVCAITLTAAYIKAERKFGQTDIICTRARGIL